MTLERSNKNLAPSENLECTRLVDYLNLMGIPFSHIPNEGLTKKQRIHNKRLGTSPGVPDYFCVVKRRIVFIEMKRRVGSRVSPEQQRWIDILTMAGIPVRVCKGFHEAKEFIEELLQ